MGGIYTYLLARLVLANDSPLPHGRLPQYTKKDDAWVVFMNTYLLAGFSAEVRYLWNEPASALGKALKCIHSP
jgi:hypothetical protein